MAVLMQLEPMTCGDGPHAYTVQSNTPINKCERHDSHPITMQTVCICPVLSPLLLLAVCEVATVAQVLQTRV